MKKTTHILVYILIAACVSGCAFFRPKAGIETPAADALFGAYSGPKARVTVADFDIKATKATTETVSGIRDMLIAALLNSNRFLIVDRKAQAGSGQSADLIITASVSEFEPQASGGRAGVGGGGGGGSGIMGGLLGTSLNKSHISLDISIIDTLTSKSIAANHVQGQASDTATAVKGGAFGSGLSAGVSAYANTPMEKAMRICIIEAVRYICQTTPASYYKYSQNGKT